jgi:hypothetical protein
MSKNRTLFFLVLVIAALFLAGPVLAQGSTVYLPIIIKPPDPPSDLDITALVYEGSDEFVEIRNNGAGSQSMAGWTLISVVGPQTYNFPAITLGPGQTVRIHSGSGAFDSPPADLFWTDAFIWNNAGDKAELRDNLGNLVDDRCYGSGCP